MRDIKHLKQLVALYEAGSITAAAEVLHISQPALTVHLSRIESDLGEQLFVRSVKGLSATPLGRTVYERSKRMLQYWAAFDSDINLLAGGDTGEIRVVCGPVIEQGILPDACVRFLQDFPRVKLKVDALNPDQMLDRLNSGTTDIAIGSFQNVDGVGTEALNSRDMPIKFYVRPEHPLLNMENWQERMKDYPLAGPQIPLDSMRWIDQSGLLVTERSLASNSYALLKYVASKADYVIGAPEFLFAKELKTGAFIELPIKETPRWVVSVLVPQPVGCSRIMKYFIACIKEQMALI